VVYCGRPPANHDSHFRVLLLALKIDIEQLSEAELRDLNRRIVERLNLIQSAKHLVQIAQFTVGMTVEFDGPDRAPLRGTISRLNRKSVTVITATGMWRVSPGLVRVVEPDKASERDGRARVIHMPPGGRRD